MTMGSLVALLQDPAGARAPTARTDRAGADAGALWASIAGASSDDTRTEATQITEAPALIDATATDDETATGDAAAPGVAPFDLPAFLQVLPKAGMAVAVAAGREPAMADAVRRLPIREMPGEAAVASRPLALQQGASLQLPAFLVPATERSGPRSAGTHGATPGSTPSETQLGAFAALRGALQSVLAARPTTAVAATGASASGKAVRTGAASAPSGDGAPIVGETAKVSSVVASAWTTGRELAAQGVDPRHAADRRAAEPRQYKVAGSAAAVNALSATAQPAIGPANAPTTESVTTPSTSSSPSDLSGLVALTAPPTAASDTSSAAAGFGTADGLLRSPVGSERWQEELGAQLAVMVVPDGESEAVMKLAPEELGELEIRLQIRDGEASVQFGAVNAEARQAIEAAQPRLREMFASQGMGVSNFSVFNTLSGNPHSPSKHGEGSSRSPRSGAAVRDEIEVRVTGRETQGIVDLYA